MRRTAANHSRRQFVQASLALTGLHLLFGCGIPLPGQQAAKIPRIGYLALSTSTENFEVFRDGLRELSYLETRAIVIEERWAQSNDQLTGLAVELVGLPVDLLVASGTAAIQAAMAATSTIPIVMAPAGNPVQAGFVASLARPGGNVTGLSVQGQEIQAKRLQLLREMAPGVSRILLLADTAASEASGDLREAQSAAQSLGVQLLRPDVRGAADLPAAFEMAVINRAQGLLVSGHPFILGERERIIAFATAAGLPLMSQDRLFTAAGGLISYGPTRFAQHRRAATYVDKILKGAKPGDLPVEQPTTFDFVLNLKTAQALRLTIPQSVLQQATEILQ